jgi:hypothetical protein
MLLFPPGGARTLTEVCGWLLPIPGRIPAAAFFGSSEDLATPAAAPADSAASAASAGAASLASSSSFFSSSSGLASTSSPLS